MEHFKIMFSVCNLTIIMTEAVYVLCCTQKAAWRVTAYVLNVLFVGIDILFISTELALIPEGIWFQLALRHLQTLATVQLKHQTVICFFFFCRGGGWGVLVSI